MMNLREMQSQFYAAVFEHKDDGKNLAAISQTINGSENISPAGRLRIYRDSVIGKLTRALGEIYPVCRRLVGQKFFDVMAASYVRKVSSDSPDLGDYGGDFAEFIATYKPAAELVYMPDVARLEWAWHRAFHAADETGLDVAALSELSEQAQKRIVFQLPVSATLLASDYPIHRIWEVNQEDWQGDSSVDLDEGQVRLVVWRQAYDMRIDPLDEKEWQFLIAVEEQQSFSRLCELDATLDIGALLPQCIQQGWIAAFFVLNE